MTAVLYNIRVLICWLQITSKKFIWNFVMRKNYHWNWQHIIKDWWRDWEHFIRMKLYVGKKSQKIINHLTWLDWHERKKRQKMNFWWELYELLWELYKLLWKLYELLNFLESFMSFLELYELFLELYELLWELYELLWELINFYGSFMRFLRFLESFMSFFWSFFSFCWSFMSFFSFLLNKKE